MNRRCLVGDVISTKSQAPIMKLPGPRPTLPGEEKLFLLCPLTGHVPAK